MKFLPSRLTIACALAAVATLVACGGGGGGGSSGGSSGSSTTTTVTAYKGIFTTGTVLVKDSGGSQVATGTITNGTVSVTIPGGTSYPVTVYAYGTYKNEVTGSTDTISSANAIRSVIPDAATAASGIPVSALTEIAASVIATKVTNGESLSAEMVKSSITTVAAAVLNMTYAEAMTAPVFDNTGKTTDANTLKLAALAIVSNGVTCGGCTLAEKVTTLANQIAANNTDVSSIITTTAMNNAITNVNQGGAYSQVPTGTTSPVAVPSVTVATYAVNETVGASTSSTNFVWSNDALTIPASPPTWNNAKWQ